MHNPTHALEEEEQVRLAIDPLEPRSRVLELEATVTELHQTIMQYLVIDEGLACGTKRDVSHCAICRALSTAEAAVDGLRA